MVRVTFKENCHDVLNTKVVDVINGLRSYGINVTVCAPGANAGGVQRGYGLDILHTVPENKFDAVVLAVAHNEFTAINIFSLEKEKA